MPIPDSSYQRTLKHTRKIQADFYIREDGLWDIEGYFIDVKPFDMPISADFSVPANQPLHSLWIRLTTDTKATIVGVQVGFDNVPFPGYCENIELQYQKLVGLNMLKSFRKGVRERMGGIDGCTHLNELIEQLPYVAFQVFVFGEKETRGETAFQPSGEKPFHLDGCHAVRTDGPIVAKYYPAWTANSLTPQKKQD